MRLPATSVRTSEFVRTYFDGVRSICQEIDRGRLFAAKRLLRRRRFISDVRQQMPEIERRRIPSRRFESHVGKRSIGDLSSSTADRIISRSMFLGVVDGNGHESGFESDRCTRSSFTGNSRHWVFATERPLVAIYSEKLSVAMVRRFQRMSIDYGQRLVAFLLLHATAPIGFALHQDPQDANRRERIAASIIFRSAIRWWRRARLSIHR